MRIDLRRHPGCPNAKKLRELLDDCMGALGLNDAVIDAVGDYPSPTVLVNGVDVMTGRADDLRGSSTPPQSPHTRAPHQGAHRLSESNAGGTEVVDNRNLTPPAHHARTEMPPAPIEILGIALRHNGRDGRRPDAQFTASIGKHGVPNPRHPLDRHRSRGSNLRLCSPKSSTGT